MKKIALLVVAGACASAASADLVAYWNYNVGAASGTQATLPLAASFGTGALTSNFAAANIVHFNGTTLEAQFGDSFGNDIGFAGDVNNGNYIQWSFDTTGFQDLVLTSAIRRTSTGFNSYQVLVSDDGVNFSNFTTVDGSAFSTTYGVLTIDLTGASILNDSATAAVRLILNGTTSSSGNIRLDNTRFEGNLIPTPGAVALMGLGGLLAARRRR